MPNDSEDRGRGQEQVRHERRAMGSTDPSFVPEKQDLETSETERLLGEIDNLLAETLTYRPEQTGCGCGFSG